MAWREGGRRRVKSREGRGWREKDGKKKTGRRGRADRRLWAGLTAALQTTNLFLRHLSLTLITK